ncbi:hypothetical protein I7I50_00388 [Histoplasma capsulatum G186AR]|uniref:Uncharacterized protein n=1 Tax=Ajellomyces capsulatus TaxID=5037 RepID=A0A8H7YJG7_AJECA|nr:hypothetical protein I7I52_07656 [Histoplasma capsulatum]QSS72521.1 hypothetical protein I7I50_00388 [Histoplasma capsulatum G186AR]
MFPKLPEELVMMADGQFLPESMSKALASGVYRQTKSVPLHQTSLTTLEPTPGNLRHKRLSGRMTVLNIPS